MQPASGSFFVDSRKIPSRVSIPLSSGKRRSTGIVTAVDDAVLREAPLSIILDLRRKPIVEPLSPLLGPFQSRSQNGSFQEGAALLVPFRSRSQNGSFQVRSSFQERVVLRRPLSVLYRPRRSSTISEPLSPSFEDLRRFLHLPSLRKESILSPSLG